MTDLIELWCYISPAVRKAASAGNLTQDYVPWRVDPTKPFEDVVNFGALSQSLGVHLLCELCDYSEGAVRTVIDTRRTPEELGFRPHMSVFLREKRTSSKSGTARSFVGVALTPEEERVVTKLRDLARSSMVTPDTQCVVCSRNLLGGSKGSLRRGSPGSAREEAHSPGGVVAQPYENHMSSQFRLRCEVGIQCGSANRFGEPLMPVAFGSASRLQATEGQFISATVNEFPSPLLVSNSNFIPHEGEVTELKSQRDKLKADRDQLANLLREEQRKTLELQRERAEHRCDSHSKVQEYVKEIETLQANLRDLMRGRQESYALLHQRRTTGKVLSDAPFGYAPFQHAAPFNGTPSTTNPHELLDNFSIHICSDCTSPPPYRAVLRRLSEW
jgi:hypothetical protein